MKINETETDNDSKVKSEKEAKDIKLRDYLATWHNTYVRTNNSPREMIRKEQLIRIQINPILGNKFLHELKPSDGELLKAELKSDYDASTVNKALGIVKKAINSAIADQLILYNPFQVVSRLPMIVSNDSWDWLNPDESESLLSNVKKSYPHWYVYFLVLLRTGIRIGELAGLFWEDIDFKEATLTVRRSLVLREYGPPKSKKERIIPLTESVVSALKAHQLKTRMLKPVKVRILGKSQKGTHVFIDQNNKPHKYLFSSIKRPLKNALRAAGIRIIRPHDLRHSFASQLRLKGISIEDIQELLGHSEIKMTLRYAHISPKKKRIAVDMLERDTLVPEITVCNYKQTTKN